MAKKSWSKGGDLILHLYLIPTLLLYWVGPLYSIAADKDVTIENFVIKSTCVSRLEYCYFN